MEMLGKAGIPGGAVFDSQELRDDAYLRKRGMFVTVQHPVRGDFTMPGWPVKMTESHVPVVCSPLLGQHNEEVLGEMLGYTREQVAKLKAEKVL
jgi:formyl-CoA transferase